MARFPQASQEQFAELIRQARFPENTLPSTVFRLLAHAPAVATILQELALDRRLRQLVVLRVIQRCQAWYAWVQHAAIAAAVGVNNAKSQRWSKAIDQSASLSIESRRCSRSPTRSWTVRASRTRRSRARGQFSPREVVEVLLTVGYFRMIGSLTTTLDVQPDPTWAVTVLERALDPDPGARG
jgi:alkylhydroperoxidase family enzyme